MYILVSTYFHSIICAVNGKNIKKKVKNNHQFLIPVKVTIADLIQIAPQDFEKRSAQAIEDNINAKYSDKVIHKVGLCLGLYDILETSEGLIGHGTGIVNVNVDFRLIVFRPFKGEILQGRIVSNTEMGIRISMDFFEDIFVPAPHMLFDPAHFDQAEQTWVWRAGEGAEFFFDNFEHVRFRVEGETWTDLSPDKQQMQAEQAENEEQNEARISPYEITVSEFTK